MSWLGRLFRRERLERELDKELKFHIETRAQELIANGVAPVEARRRALAEFGGIEPIKETARDARGTRWVEDFFQDVKYALRMLRSNKGFAIAAVLSLAAGIGANAAVFRVIDGLILRPMDVAKPQELIFVHSEDIGGSRFSHPAYLQFAEAGAPAEFAVNTAPNSAQITLNGATELRSFQLVSGNWFSLLGLGAQTGRVLTPADDSISDPRSVVVISDRYWTRQFARSAAAVGSEIQINKVPVEIVGVAPAGFTGTTIGSPTDFWLPASLQHTVRHRNNASTDNADSSKPWTPQDGIAWLSIIARAPADTRAALLTRLNARYRQIVERRFEGSGDKTRRERWMRDKIVLADASRGASALRTQLTPALRVLMGMVGLVLLVACANLANLLLARGAARGREFALRLSIGARRSRLVRQLLTESMTLATLGGVAGLAVAWWGGTALLRAVSTTSAPIPVALPVEWRVVAFGVGATILTGILFGLVPALRLSRPSANDALKSGTRVVGSGRRGSLPLVKILVAVQVAVSLLLLTGAVLFFRTFQNLVHVEAGFDRTSVMTARFDTRLAGFDTAQLPAIYARLIDETSRLPGVTSSTIAVVGTVTGAERVGSMEIDGYTPGPGEETRVHEEIVGPAYFSTLGMRLLSGRDFTDRDDERAKKVAIINETFARRYFGTPNPLGRTIGFSDAKEFEVIGVVADVRANGLRVDVPSMAYLPLKQRSEEYARNLYIRSAGSLETMGPSLKEAIARAVPGLAVREVLPLGELAERTVATERMISRLTGLFGLLGVAVACLGLYGTIAYSVARRTNEIGVRLALGASPGGVRNMVLKETLTLVGVGVVCGLAMILPLGRLLAAQLYGLSPRDPLTLAASALTVVAVGLLAGVIPAWRAARVNPTSALRAD
jgi:predicted permease